MLSQLNKLQQTLYKLTKHMKPTLLLLVILVVNSLLSIALISLNIPEKLSETKEYYKIVDGIHRTFASPSIVRDLFQ